MAMPGIVPWPAPSAPSVIIQFPIVPMEQPGITRASHLPSSVLNNNKHVPGHLTLTTNNLDNDIRHMGMGLSCSGWERGWWLFIRWGVPVSVGGVQSDFIHVEFAIKWTRDNQIKPLDFQIPTVFFNPQIVKFVTVQHYSHHLQIL